MRPPNAKPPKTAEREFVANSSNRLLKLHKAEKEALLQLCCVLEQMIEVAQNNLFSTLKDFHDLKNRMPRCHINLFTTRDTVHCAGSARMAHICTSR
jgi:hypothetical protein